VAAAVSGQSGQPTVATAILQGLDGLAQRHGAQSSNELTAFRRVAQVASTKVAASEPRSLHPLTPRAWEALPSATQELLVKDVVRAVVLRAHTGMGTVDPIILRNVVKARLGEVKADKAAVEAELESARGALGGLAGRLAELGKALAAHTGHTPS
jgi:hypothetical protein